MNRQVTTTAATAAALLLLACPAFGQTTGTSHPEDLHDTITTDAGPQSPYASSQHYVKPSPYVPMTSTAQSAPAASAYQPYRPYQPPASSDQVPLQTRSDEPETAAIRYSNAAPVVTDDPNSGVVISVPYSPDELPEGALLRARLVSPLSTESTRWAAPFAASLTADLRRDGRVLLPAGTLIRGRVSDIHGGRRIAGAASIHLHVDSLLLPDGTAYPLSADVIDLDHFTDSHVNSEGTIIANGHPKATLSAVGLATGSSAVAGAVIGGGVGAVVGAGIGAGVSTVWWLKKEHQETLPEGTELVFSLDSPLHLTPAAQ